MGTSRSPSAGYDPNAPLVERLRFVLYHWWRGDLPAELPDPVDPPVVGRRVTDEGVEEVEEIEVVITGSSRRT